MPQCLGDHGFSWWGDLGERSVDFGSAPCLFAVACVSLVQESKSIRD